MQKCYRDTYRTHLDCATDLTWRVCEISGHRDLIEDIRGSFRENGLLDAIRYHDNDAIFDWLVEVISYQGISDSVAESYIEEHGIASAWDIRQELKRKGLCPKLQAYWTYESCGYRKWSARCNEPSKFRRCPLPKHNLRNGSLNQASYSLFLFMRDVCSGDFVSWLDKRFLVADQPMSPIRGQLLGNAVIEPLLHVHGVSHKVLHMTLASFLLAGDTRRKRWQTAGAAMIAVDTLVHAWLWRTGIMRRLGTQHSYGPACYSEKGCKWIINRLSQEIDAREFNPSFAQDFPRFVQHAIWSFCAASGLDQCNGNRIDDRKRCAYESCALFEQCDRIALDPHRTLRSVPG